MHVIVIIPARYASTRFPGKPLCPIAGKPMIRHVYERACRSARARRVVVAADDARILEAVRGFGGEALQTSVEHRSGTDRVAEAADALDLAPEDLVVNIQGDQPLFEPAQIDEVLDPLLEDPERSMSTLVYEITVPEEVTDPNIVKTVFDVRMRALYFSRATIPFPRGGEGSPIYYKHHGIYAYRRRFLREFAQWNSGSLEEIEKLEQLRVLEYGVPIYVAVSRYDSTEVDTPEDIRKVERVLEGT